MVFLNYSFYSWNTSFWNLNQLLWTTIVSFNNTQYNFLLLVSLACASWTFTSKKIALVGCLLTTPVLVKYTWLTYPQQLVVGYNNIHPVLFYLAFLAVFFFIAPFEFIGGCKSTSISSVAAISLVLGGYWGLNNTAWGFFWVNDFIEWILLLLVILSFSLFHHRQVTRSLSLYLIMTASLFLLIILSRYGFIFTRHSFFDLNKSVNYLFAYTLLNVQSTIWLVVVFFYFSQATIFISILNSWQVVDVRFFSRTYMTALHLIIIVFALAWIQYTPLHQTLKADVYDLALVNEFTVLTTKTYLYVLLTKNLVKIYFVSVNLFLLSKWVFLKTFLNVLFCGTIYVMVVLISITKIYAS